MTNPTNTPDQCYRCGCTPCTCGESSSNSWRHEKLPEQSTQDSLVDDHIVDANKKAEPTDDGMLA